MLFDYLNTYHYGRCVKDNNWNFKTIGINRVYWIHRGEISVLLDNVRYDLKERYIYLFPQNLKFELILKKTTEVDHSFFDFFTLPAIKMNGPIEVDPRKYPIIGESSRILFQLAELYPTYPSTERNEYSDVTESYLDNMLFLIDREFPISRIEDPRINRVLDYIHRHYDEDVTLDKLLELVNLEKNYFIRLFKSCMNITPYQYIKKYRFNIALSLLKRKCTLYEVARKVGYTDAVSFSHAFKENYGFPPSLILSHNKTLQSE